MAAHAPYIMPDGRSLTHYLAQEREREQLRRRKAELRGKDLQFAQLLRQRGASTSEMELAELKAMEAAGVRRRRRWLNDKTLRDLAGPLSAADMEAQFKPAPFGGGHVPSPLAQALTPAHAALWDNFRSIDPEKEARVLQKWAAHQRESAPPRQRQQRGPTQAALALQRWAGVGRRARAALKRANPASVMQMELQMLDFFEQAAPGAQLLLPLEDPFARLLAHGLADFHGLLSASRSLPHTGEQAVAVYRRNKPLSSSSTPNTGTTMGATAGGAADGVGSSPGGARTPGSATQRPRSAAVAGASPGGASPSPSPFRLGATAAAPSPSSSSTGPSPARGAAVGPSPGRGGLLAAAAAAGPSSAAAAESTTPLPGERGASPLPPRMGSSSGAATGIRGGGTSSPLTGRAVSAGRSTSAGRGAAGASGAEQQQQQHEPEITCTDVLLALAEVGQLGLNEASLRRYVHVHIHGTPGAEGGVGGVHRGQQGERQWRQ
ncbi:hypothetical protein Agub_g160 [Astrephomene gubernaculifera]|uniref:R3H domain-containing protein n=1 Tax=Astrephomene gubernaculifera TaxID=47775 RepID=A0AAD3DD93_9CHLO|nr:hypothetical protein Agub_g160 [Astrephomene gubernaculifera]